MEKIQENKVTLLIFIVLSVITLGMYPIVWLASQRENFNSILDTPITLNDVVIFAALQTWYATLPNYMSDDDTINAVLGVIMILFLIAYYIFTYTKFVKPIVTKIDELLMKDHKIDLRPNKIWMFIFGYFYLSYTTNHINELIERAKKLN